MPLPALAVFLREFTVKRKDFYGLVLMPLPALAVFLHYSMCLAIWKPIGVLMPLPALAVFLHRIRQQSIAQLWAS